MLSWLTQLIAPPHFPDDEEKARVAVLLNALLLTLMLLLSLMALSNLFSAVIGLDVAVELIVVVVLLVMRWFLFRGYVNPLSHALVTILSIAVAFGIFLSGTIRAPIVSTYVLIIVTAGLLLSRNGLIATIIANGIIVTFLIYAEIMGWMRPQNLNVSIAQWVTMISVMIYAGALTYWARRGIRNALVRAQHELAERRHIEDHLEAEVVARTSDLNMALKELHQRAEAQDQLLQELAKQRTTIRELSVPVLPIGQHTLVIPLVGALDDGRLEDLQMQALDAVERTRARRVLLDITGLPVVDTHVARGLLDTVAALRLLGAQAVLVGIRPEVAQTIVGLGLDLRDIPSYADLEMALR